MMGLRRASWRDHANMLSTASRPVRWLAGLCAFLLSLPSSTQVWAQSRSAMAKQGAPGYPATDQILTRESLLRAVPTLQEAERLWGRQTGERRERWIATMETRELDATLLDGPDDDDRAQIIEFLAQSRWVYD